MPNYAPGPACSTAGRGTRAGGGRCWQTAGMRTLVRLMAGAALLAGAAMLFAAGALLQTEPIVPSAPSVDQQDVARALSLLRTHDPRRAQPGAIRAVFVSERDIEVLLSHGAHRWFDVASRVQLQRGRASVQLSSRAPPNPFGAWLNVELRLEETGGLPVVDSWKVGRLPLPSWLARRVGVALIERAGLRTEFDLAVEVVRRVHFAPQQMRVTYAWQGDSAGRLINGLLTAEELQRLRPYSDRLVELSSQARPSFEMPLAPLLGPMFRLARDRTLAGGDAAAENRAALLVLTLHANGRTVGALAPAARAWPQPQPMRLLLAGRTDFPLHFLISATLAAEGTSPLSRAIGLYKEVADSRGGSGFSFNDMAANRAGTRFGELIVRAPQAFQERLAQGVQDAELLPHTRDLPEFLTQAEFQRRFGGVGGPGYNELLADIDRRIGALTLLR